MDPFLVLRIGLNSHVKVLRVQCDLLSYINSIKERCRCAAFLLMVHCRWRSQPYACDFMATDFVLNIKS